MQYAVHLSIGIFDKRFDMLQKYNLSVSELLFLFVFIYFKEAEIHSNVALA